MGRDLNRSLRRVGRTVGLLLFSMLSARGGSVAATAEPTCDEVTLRGFTTFERVLDAAGALAGKSGEYGARVLTPLLPTLEAAADVPVRLLPVVNHFFGGNIAVTGLLTAADVSAALACEPADHRYLLPDVVLSDDRFLDGGRVTDLPRPVEVVGTTGADLVRALR